MRCNIHHRYSAVRKSRRTSAVLLSSSRHISSRHNLRATGDHQASRKTFTGHSDKTTAWLDETWPAILRFHLLRTSTRSDLWSGWCAASSLVRVHAGLNRLLSSVQETRPAYILLETGVRRSNRERRLRIRRQQSVHRQKTNRVETVYL